MTDSLLSHRLVNAVQGITWRLALGIDKPEEPEGKFSFSHMSRAGRSTLMPKY